MECNKEDAIKAKELAEKKMRIGDFQGARKTGAKAQRLYPSLDNITQLLTVCDVHCSAANKLYGSEMDWYGILQIERLSDELVVKKQFRKLALSLHPDKNKFPGAEAAFKLIGEANRVLSDPAKRAVYDARFGGVSRATKPKPEQPNQYTNIKKQHPTTDKTRGVPHPYQQPLKGVFWTRCPPCNMWYQYLRQYEKKVLKCQNCSQPFIAHDLGMPSGANFADVPVSKAGKAADTAGNTSGIGKDSKPQEKVNGHADVKAGKKDGSVSMPDVCKTKGSENADSSSNRRSSESFDRVASGGKQNGSNVSAEKSQVNDGLQTKSSLRKKPDITSDKKSSSDDDFVVPPPKRSKVEDSPVVADKEMKESSGLSRSSKKDTDACFTPVVLSGANNGAKQKVKSSLGDEPSNKKSKTKGSKVKEDEAVVSEKGSTGQKNMNDKSEIETNKLDSDIHVIPDPDFSNFEKEREQSQFAVNQVWALYDSVDSMPRFYARIRKVINPGFKLQITWLETRATDKAEKKWSNSGLPVACGRYVNGDTEITEDNLMFSHKMSNVKSGSSDSYFVYPKKGETWALYKNWNLNWSAEPEKHEPPFDYDLVVILTDFIKEVGIGLAYLRKVKGFISVFQRDTFNEALSFTVRPNELYKFSHQIPSFKLTGNEREGIPVGSYELDTAALPASLFTLVENVKLPGSKKPSQPESTSARQTTEKSPNSKNPEKNKFTADALTPRRSPRDLSKIRSQMHTSRSTAETIDLDAETSKDNNHAQPASLFTLVDNVKLPGSKKPSQPESTSAHQTTEKSPNSKNPEKNKFTADALTPRRSPRDLSKRRSQMHTSRSTAETIDLDAETSKDNNHAQPGSSAGEREDKKRSRVIQVEPFDFKKLKSEDKFEVGQIWALLSDEDGLPKIYCQVKKIDRSPSFRLHVAKLKNLRCSVGPQSCGIYQVADGEPVVLSLTAFSHQVKVRPIGMGAFEIWPKKGDIWALRRNSDSEDTGGECDIVEVVEDNSKSVKVTVLKELKETIFVTPKGSKRVSMEIRRGEFADRFSHQCSAFHMGDEDKRLNGSWQLDLGSIPGSVIIVE